MRYHPRPSLPPIIIPAITILLALPVPAGAQLPTGVAIPDPEFRPVASYEMDVALDRENHLVTGTEILTFHNSTRFPVTELRFHAYYNAWKTDGSTWMTLAGLSLPAEAPEERLAWLQVTDADVLPNMFFGREDILETFAYIQPDDGNPFDQTLFRLELPHPLPAGGEVRLQLAFTLKVPRPISRTGYIGDYYFLSQWFPKIGVLTDEGWEAHQYFPVEYFADYGTYDVRLTVPSDCVVGATGELVGRPEVHSDGTTTHRFRQEMVHDFAWTAWPKFLVYTEDFAFMPGRTVALTLLLCPEHKGLAERYLQAVRYGVRYYSEWFGPYPYTTATCVDPAYNSRSGGMEYPTFFTGGAPLFPAEGVLSPEGVTVHEFGHGYWYGIVGNNETVHAWLDEGFNSYSESRVQDVAYGPNHASMTFFNLPIVFDEVEIPFRWGPAPYYRSIAKFEPLDRPSYLKRFSYGGNAYNKGELFHWTMEGLLGWETWQRVMAAYFEEWKFRHPTPEDFFTVAIEVSGVDLSEFFDQFYRRAETLDFAVGPVRNRALRLPHGSFERPALAPEAGPEWAPEAPDAPPEGFACEVTVRRLGEMILPVEVLVGFSDGEEIVERWDGRERSITFRYRRPVGVNTVVVDPDEKLVLDVNRTNNSWLRTPDRRGAWKLVLRWLFWVQSVLEFFAFIS